MYNNNSKYNNTKQALYIPRIEVQPLFWRTNCLNTDNLVDILCDNEKVRYGQSLKNSIYGLDEGNHPEHFQRKGKLKG